MLRLLSLAAATLIVGAAVGQAQEAVGSAVDFRQAFTPATIGPGSGSALTFTIENFSGGPVTDLAFTNTLPGGLTIASPSGAETTCSGGGRTTASPSVSAPAGGATLTFSGGSVAGSSTCTVTVHVTSPTPGAFDNTPGPLTHSLGASFASSATLTVDAGRPGFSKRFTPASVVVGGRSTLTFLIDNSANASSVFGPTFQDDLPVGLTVASPSRAQTDCPGGTVEASGSSVALAAPGFGQLPAGATCTVSVDVEATGAGQLENITESLLYFTPSFAQESAGFASDALTATAGGLLLTKSFVDDPTPPGGTVDLRFTLANLSRTDPASGLDFTDDLGAALAGLTASSVVSNTCAGATIGGVGTTFLSFSGGSLAAEGSCAVTVRLDVPVSAAPGVYTNTSSTLTGTVGGSPLVGNAAVADLFVSPVPRLTKEFTDDPVVAGGTATLEFTLTNTSPTEAATDLAFSDVFDFLPIPASASSVPADGFCGAGSSLSFFPGSSPTGSPSTPPQLTVSGASLSAGASCTFAVVLDIPLSLGPGNYPNVTSEVTGVVGGVSVTGAPASDDLAVIAGPSLTKTFVPESVARGEVTRLLFTLSHSPDASSSATSIGFTDDLEATLTGLAPVAGQLPRSVCGGTLSFGSGVLTFSGGTLAPGEDCSLSVRLVVPGDAAYGAHTNTTSALSAVVGGLPVASAAAEADLSVTPIVFQMAFAQIDPAAGTGLVGYRISNRDPSMAVNISFFQHELSLVLPGLQAALPETSNTCGSSLSGTTTLTVLGGSVPASGRCGILVPVTFTPDPDPGTYGSTTGTLVTSVGNVAPASGAIVIDSQAPLFSKAFSPATLLAGEVSTLTFTIDNSAQGGAATGLDFSDVFPVGVVVAPVPNNSKTCTGGMLSAGPGDPGVSFSGGEVGAGEVCTISVDVTAAAEGIYENVSGTLSSSRGTSDAATAELTVLDPDLYASKTVAFEVDGDGEGGPANGTVDTGDVLRYTVTITNRTASPVEGMVFTDTPDAISELLAGTVTTSAGTVATGNGPGETTVAVDVGTLAAAASVTITFDVSLPSPIPDAVAAVCNQGEVAATFFRTIRTDDPTTDLVEDPTCVPHDRPAIDLVITSAEIDGGGMASTAGGGAVLRVFTTAENTTDDGVTYRRRLLLTYPDGRRVTIRQAPRERLEAGATADASLVTGAPVALPFDAPFGDYTVTVRAIVLPSLEVVDVEEQTVRYEGMLARAADAALADVRTGAGPNPFTRSTSVRFAVEEAAQVDLRVFDATGREVAVLASGELPRGVHELPFDGAGRPAGVYLWRLIVDGEQTTGAVTLVR